MRSAGSGTATCAAPSYLAGRGIHRIGLLGISTGAEAVVTEAASDPRVKAVVHDVARTRPLLLVGTVAFEREFDRAYTRGTKATLWELPQSAHTRGLEDYPHAYAARVLSLFDRALL